MRMTPEEFNALVKSREVGPNSGQKPVVRVVKGGKGGAAIDEIQKPVGVSSVQIYRIVLPVPPSSNNAYANAPGGRVLSAAGKQYKTTVKRIIGESLQPFESSVEFRIKFYRKQKSGDLDNRIKICMDAFKGLAFIDDEQVSRIVAERFEDPVNPRIEVEIFPI